MDQRAEAITAIPSSTVYDAKNPLHEIEEDIARTRARLSASIEALERELAPRRLLERGAEVLRSSLDANAGRLGKQVWVNAIPLALIAAGLGWLFLLRVRSERGINQGDDPAEIGLGVGPVDAVDLGEVPSPAPSYVNVVDPVEPVSLVHEKTPL